MRPQRRRLGLLQHFTPGMLTVAVLARQESGNGEILGGRINGLAERRLEKVCFRMRTSSCLALWSERVVVGHKCNCPIVPN